MDGFNLDQIMNGIFGFTALTIACTVIPVVLVIGAVVFLIVRQSRRASEAHAASLYWPWTEGTVIASLVETQSSSDGQGGSSTSYVPRIVYEYYVNDYRYRCDQLRAGHQFFSARTGGYMGAQEVVDRYPVGLRVPVYYNPENPSEAALER